MTPLNSYFSTFISGFSEIVEEQLKKQFSDVVIDMVLDGLIVYKTSAAVDEVKKIPYLNNSFIFLQQTQLKKEDTNASIVKRLFNETNGDDIIRCLNVNKPTTFRIFISRENELISIHKEIIEKIEKRLLTKSDHFTVDRQRADCEFWFMIRSEKHAFFGARITHLRDQQKKEYQQGELKKELAYLLCLLSEPGENDICVDPFAGSGSIPIARAHMSPYKKIVAADLDEDFAFNLKRKMREIKNSEVFQLDAMHLFPLGDESVDKIVTDPPWGLYQPTHIDIDLFYTQMVTELYRILKKDGVMVLLASRKNNLEKVIGDFKEKLKITKKLNILVSGKKATIYKIVKKYL